jgi:hypothetical protein
MRGMLVSLPYGAMQLPPTLVQLGDTGSTAGQNSVRTKCCILMKSATVNISYEDWIASYT